MKNHDPKKIEKKIYKLWEKSGFFNPDNLSGKKPYTIALPPPNVTGELHMGHALNTTVQDILIRYKRMKGYKALWIPGTDHAGIATQNVVEKKLKKEGLTRFDLGRKDFIKEVWKWKKKYGGIILDQFKKMGASCDWSRTRFTMDKEYAKAVEKAFLYYYKKGLIYKGERIVNWCSRCMTSLSDLELEYEEEKGSLWFIKYPISGEKGFITIATTRPETMFGDLAIAVNPKDERYEGLIGKKAVLPIVEKEIPIISDRAIDKDFGTGALKVTPAHDFADWEIGERNKLGLLGVIDERGRMKDNVPLKYRGMKVLDARKETVKELLERKLIKKEEAYTHNIPVCYRCGTTVENILSKQWFLKMKELSKLALSPVKKGEVEFTPKSFEKAYFNWLNNIRDWCISRQIWWGHKVPLKGETDVLDTWFSSALWPFATLGWPEKTKALKKFYPTDTLSTGRDIITLWVLRMIFSGEEFLKKPPFSRVYIHATILAKDGRRMSKSLGTGVNPVNLIDRYGADAVRFGLAYQVTGAQDIKFSEDGIIMGKKFCNKIWNASKFVLQRKRDFTEREPAPITAADKRIMKKLKETAKKTEKNIDNFEFGKAARLLYSFFWHDFCDTYIEKAKKQKDRKNTDKILSFVLINSLKLLHPFIPFVTEEIYQKSPKGKRYLMVEKWPKL